MGAAASYTGNVCAKRDRWLAEQDREHRHPLDQRGGRFGKCKVHDLASNGGLQSRRNWQRQGFNVPCFEAGLVETVEEDGELIE